MRRSSRLARRAPCVASPAPRTSSELRKAPGNAPKEVPHLSQKRDLQVALPTPLPKVEDVVSPEPRRATRRKRAKVEKSANRQFVSKQIESTKIEPSVSTVEDIEIAPELSAPCDRPSAAEARTTLEVLVVQHGRQKRLLDHPKTKRRPVLDSLIATILSQATSNTNSSRAFKSLKAAFPEWNLALNAGPTGIADAIRIGGLADAKGKRIHAILEELSAKHSECTLEHLRDVDDDAAKRVLCAFPGVGPKTAACVLMFGMNRAEFPVDTHVRRITTRLGWMPEGSSAEAVYDKLNACLPSEIKYDLHVLLIAHGRALCNARAPKCGQCPLRKNCRYFLENESKEDDALG